MTGWDSVTWIGFIATLAMPLIIWLVLWMDMPAKDDSDMT